VVQNETTTNTKEGMTIIFMDQKKAKQDHKIPFPTYPSGKYFEV
jgi:hypothetical protein